MIIVEKNYQIDAESIEFFPDTIKALNSIGSQFLKVVITNQSGIARSLFSASDVDKFNGFLSDRLRDQGIVIDGWYYCPHAPEDECDCRKPKPGMLLTAAKDFSIALKKSWIIGDKSSDIEAGRAAGVKTILVGTGYRGHEPGASDTKPDYSFGNLLDAIMLINGSVN